MFLNVCEGCFHCYVDLYLEGTRSTQDNLPRIYLQFSCPHSYHLT
jgi:hypothetical protein